MKVRRHLWFKRDMESAVRFYTSLLPDSSIGWISLIPANSPSGPAGSAKLAGFTLGGQHFMAIEAGPLDPCDYGSSITVECATHAEANRLRSALLEKGTIEPNGLLRDGWGLYWDISPKQSLIAADRAGTARAAHAAPSTARSSSGGLAAAARG
ncbi:VOC family protein [Rhizobium sp. BK602]|uniref:VOC family protein n=1 Tax=Rhizobium sp. BK602 TaxID=2586986 RepID=UPI0016193F68|nr:VOC family protein [Rhizobium sp. BK602]MBB3612671.1 putative 3-demethylubiquinone-9 3-methyltransferase (glyoxalase superfamily) [Rhizobium sp. BK602]